MSASALNDLSPAEKRAALARILARRRAQTGSGDVAAAPSLLQITRPVPGAWHRLVCIPGLGAGAAFFAGWAEALPRVEVAVLRRPGWDALSDQPPFEDLDSALADCLAVLDPTAGSFALLGHSMGARLAFLLARELERRGTPPAHLFLCGGGAPGAQDGFAAIGSYSDEELVRTLTAHPGGREEALSAHERQAVVRRAHADAGLDARIRAALVADSAPLSVPITALAARDDAFVPIEAVAGWAHQAAGSFELVVVDGDHAFVRNAAAPVQQVVRDRWTGAARVPPRTDEPPAEGLRLGLFFFSAHEADFEDDRYQLVLDSATLADRAGLHAIWLPERHFHPVGGLFPNPAVVAAALAVRTERVRIRSGSVVLPLHDPIRVAEEWSVVDNLSSGRVELSFVPGWNPNDYAIAPESYPDRWSVMLEKLGEVRALWRGESITRRNGVGAEAKLRVFPGPCQPELPVWLTTSARDETFVRAGELGVDVITALLIQDVDGLARRVRLYREARERAGHDPEAGRVALMVHTYVGLDADEVRQTVRAPFLAYMRTVQSLWKDDVAALRLASDDDKDRVIEMVFERYLQRATLFGDPAECLRRLASFRAAGVDEIACAIDFGVPYAHTLASVRRLAALQPQLSMELS